jgi:pimeloyl-ACP methyl ester carboxylesterase
MSEFLLTVFGALFLFAVLRRIVPGTVGSVAFDAGEHETLVVFGPSLGGRTARPELERLVHSAYPAADFLTPTYHNTWISNSDPFEMTSLIEQAIRDRYDEFQYKKIILFGYSLGGLLLRKAYVWGYGFDDDRPVQRGIHPWVERVERFVSLAAPNRGWPSEKPENLKPELYAVGYIIEILARLTGTVQLILTLQQGSPFVANMRVQWINLFRDPAAHKPLVVHLVGNRDELVDRSDSIDIEAAPPSSVIIKTLEGLSHAQLAIQLYEANSDKLTPTGKAIHMAMTLTGAEFPPYWADKVMTLETDLNIKQLIFVMHGIRDESTWPLEIKSAIEKLIGAERAATVKVVPPLYRRFAMLPFLIYWDRQRNVRWFMDQYTQAKAMYPNLETVDFVGHSNGTYILASALQQYSVLEVRNVLFAGSVVPVHYNWEAPINARRVTGKIWNVCADTDWVVAIFPQFFQQISDWFKIPAPRVGLLDIGSAGYRGFRTSVSSEGTLSNVKYISGGHGAAFEPSTVNRVEAIARFVTADPSENLNGLRETSEPTAWLEYASNLSWLIWLFGLGLIAVIGVLTYQIAWWLFGAYLILLLGILSTV